MIFLWAGGGGGGGLLKQIVDKLEAACPRPAPPRGLLEALQRGFQMWHDEASACAEGAWGLGFRVCGLGFRV